MHFGEHLTIDGYEGDPEKLDNKDLVYGCLTELPMMLEMKTLSEPVLLRAEDNNVKDPGGWSGFVVIAESHISVHTFPKRKFVSIDVYTCKNGLNANQITDYFTKIFDLKDLETNFIKRGTKYPAHNLIP